MALIFGSLSDLTQDQRQALLQQVQIRTRLQAELLLQVAAFPMQMTGSMSGELIDCSAGGGKDLKACTLYIYMLPLLLHVCLARQHVNLSVLLADWFEAVLQVEQPR